MWLIAVKEQEEGEWGRELEGTHSISQCVIVLKVMNFIPGTDAIADVWLWTLQSFQMEMGRCPNFQNGGKGLFRDLD
jgi:hypothetical protein